MEIRQAFKKWLNERSLIGQRKIEKLNNFYQKVGEYFSLLLSFVLFF